MSAAHRCPVEIWRSILRSATSVPPPPFFGTHNDKWGRDFPCQMLNGEVEHSIDTYTFQRVHTSRAVAWSCARVCRLWYNICYPFVLECVYIGPTEWMPTLATMRHSFEGHECAQLVKSFYLINQGQESFAPILSACARLEEFTYVQRPAEQASPMLSAYLNILAAQCFQSLRSLEVRVVFNLPLSDICRIVLACHRLENLSCLALGAETIDPSFLVAPTEGKTLALKSLSWAVDEAEITKDNNYRSIFFDFLLSFRIPYLHNLAVIDYGPVYDEDPAPESESFMLDVLRAYGPQLRYVQFERKHSNRNNAPTNGVICAILESCPNLVTLDLSVLMTAPLPDYVGNTSLRQLVCSSFFPIGSAVRSFELDAGDESEWPVRSTLNAFFSAQFTALEVIRITEVQHLTEASRTWPSKYKWNSNDELCNVPAGCAEALEDIHLRCRERDIRLEDCTGKLVDPSAFSPVEAWFHEFHEEVVDLASPVMNLPASPMHISLN